MFFIRQNATHKIVIGPAVAVGDGFTPVTTVVLTGAGAADEAEVILHDNGTVVDISAYTWAAIATADGYYHLTLAAGITGTVGHMTVVIQDDSLILPLRADFQVVEEAVYDLLFVSTASGQVTLANGAHGGAAATLTLLSAAITNSAGTALTLSSSGGNGHGLACAGHGSGEGITATGGATGNGLACTGGATSGDGITVAAPTSGYGIAVSGTAGGLVVTASAGPGFEVEGTTFGIQAKASAGPAISAIASAGNNHGMEFAGSGSGHGAYLLGGATGNGIYTVGGVTSGSGIVAVATTEGQGMALTAAGAGRGLLINGGTTGEGVYIISGAASGLRISGATHGIEVAASAGPGVEIDGTTFGIDVGASAGNALSLVASGGNGHGFSIAGNGTGDGINVVAGASGDGIVAQGGSTTGSGLVCQADQATGAGSGISAYGFGTSGWGIRALSGLDGHAGIYAAARGNNGAGLECVKHGTGKDIDADEIDAILADTAVIGAAGIGLTALAQATVCTEGRLAELDAANLPTDVANVKTDTAAILIDTAVIGAAGAGLTAIPWNATWDAEVQSECADALTAASVSTLTAAQVNAEVVDCLQTDTPIDGKTVQSALRIIAAGVLGKVSGAGLGTEIFVGLDGTTTRATVSVDDDGNRSAVVYV